MTSTTYGLLIDGRERPGGAGETFWTHDPATDAPVAELARATAADVDDAVAAARAASHDWVSTSAAERGRLLHALALAVRDDLDRLAELESRDCGKVLSQARDDIRLAARYLDFFGGVATALHGETIPVGGDVVDFTRQEPYGVCAQINAWNFPLNMAARSLAPALAAGNTVVVKSPELAPCTTAELSRLLDGAGFPPGVVGVLHGFGHDTGAALAAHPGVDLITFTGSVATGRAIAASAARNVTPCVLELGGKSPTVVFPDADVARAATSLAHGFVEANGQSCDLPSVAIVHDDVREEFLTHLLAEVGTMTIGPGTEDPDVGALISREQRERVMRFVGSAVEAGAHVAHGGSTPDGPGLADGWFVEPTVLTDVTPSMSVYRDEIFGPVLSVLGFEDEDEAVELANGTQYGLAAFVWTRDVARSLRLVQHVKVGQVYVNCFSSGDSVMTPFGGFKSSGFGREKGFEALRTYSQTKNVCISTR